MQRESNRFWHTRFAKAGQKIAHCEKCDEFQGQVARVFASQAEFEASPHYGGEDRVINDPLAKIATWPGKSNIGRGPANWWYATPMHPHCGCEQVEYSPAHEAVKHTDWFSDLTDEELRGAA